jgi:hypothetical protein
VRALGGNSQSGFWWRPKGMRCFDCAVSYFGRFHFAQHDKYNLLILNRWVAKWLKLGRKRFG